MEMLTYRWIYESGVRSPARDLGVVSTGMAFRAVGLNESSKAVSEIKKSSWPEPWGPWCTQVRELRKNQQRRLLRRSREVGGQQGESWKLNEESRKYQEMTNYC